MQVFSEPEMTQMDTSDQVSPNATPEPDPDPCSSLSFSGDAGTEEFLRNLPNGRQYIRDHPTTKYAVQFGSDDSQHGVQLAFAE